MKLTLAYPDFKITVQAKGLSNVTDVILMGGAILAKLQEVKPKWGKPKADFEVGVFCAKCGTEVNPVAVMEKNFIDCPKCGTRIMDLPK